MKDNIEVLRREIAGAWRFRWRALSAAWILCLLGWLAVYAVPNTYEANAKFYVEARSRLDRVIDGVVVPEEVSDQVNLVRQAILGRPMLEKVATSTDLRLRAKTQDELDGLITSLKENIQLVGRTADVRFPHPLDGIYTIAYRDRDKATSMAVVDTLLNAFMEDVVRGRRSSSEETISFLRDEIAKYEGQLREREQALADFKQKNMGLLPGESGSYFERMQVATNDLEEIEAQIRNAETRRVAIRAQLGGEVPFIPEDDGNETISANQPRTDLDSRIVALETTLGDLLLRFTDNHPDVIATREQLKRLYLRRSDELEMLKASGDTDLSILSTNPVYQQLRIALNNVEVEIASLRSEAARSRARSQELTSKVNIIPQVEAELAELTRDYEQVSETYDEMRGLLEKEVISLRKKGATVENFRIIEPPFVDSLPVAPPRAALLSFVLLAGLAAGAGVGWLFHWLNPVFNDPSTLRDVTGKPVLGIVSKTWRELHATIRKTELAAIISSGAILVITFGLVFAFRDSGGLLVRQLIQRFI